MTGPYGPPTPMSSDPAASPTDAELAVRIRGGERDAFGELWSRHASAAHAVASQFRSITDPEDIVQEVSRRIFDVLLRGNGPTGDFRPYINQTVRNTAVSIARRPTAEPVGDAYDFAEENLGEQIPDYADSAVERIITIRAFKALNSRWQEVLWYISVEGMTSEEAAVLMGLSPNATASLANRAREGLRQEWLRAHTADETLPDECRWVVDHLPSFERGTITSRNRQRIEKHTAECVHCARVGEELNDLATRLPLVLLPLLVAGADIVRTSLQTLLATKVSQGAIAVSAKALAAATSTASTVGTAAAATAASLDAASSISSGFTAASNLGSSSAQAASATAEGAQLAAASNSAITGISKGIMAAKLAAQTGWILGGVAASVALVTALALTVGPTSDSSATDLAEPGQHPRDSIVLPTPDRGSAGADDTATPPPTASEAAAGTGSATPNPQGGPSAPTGNRGRAPEGNAPVGGDAGGNSGANVNANANGNAPAANAPAAPDPMTVPTVSAPGSGQLNWTSDLTMSGTGHPGWTVQILNNGSVVGSATVDSNGTWSYAPTVSSSAPMNLTVRQTDGSRTSATQAVGNYTFRVPTINRVMPADAGVVGGTHRNNVGVAVDGVAGVTVRATIGGYTSTTVLPNALSVKSVPDGTYTMTVVYEDAQGRVSAPATRTVTLP